MVAASVPYSARARRSAIYRWPGACCERATETEVDAAAEFSNSVRGWRHESTIWTCIQLLFVVTFGELRTKRLTPRSTLGSGQLEDRTVSTSDDVQKRNALAACAAFRIEGLEASLDHVREAVRTPPCAGLSLAVTMMSKRDRSATIQKCFAQLSALHREVLDLVYYHQRSVDEVAEIVGAPVSTVKTRMFYARKRMENLLDAAGLARP